MLNQHTYLYVEDDSLSRDFMMLLLTKGIGIERLYIFENSVDFIARVKALPATPDVILLDIFIVPFSGHEMLKMIRADADLRSARVIAMTARLDSDAMHKLKQDGFDGAITKPFDVSNLPALLERIVRGEEVWYLGEQ